MNAAEKKGNAAIKLGSAQNIAAVCYICGSRYASDGELCPACAKIISASLKLLRGPQWQATRRNSQKRRF